MGIPDGPATGSVAAHYDVHGNLPALDAVLADPDVVRADRIVVGGDVVLGPMPRDTLDRRLAFGPHVQFRRGNCDRLVVDAVDGRSLAHLPPAVRETVAWTAGQLDRAQRDVLAGWPATLTVDVPGLGDVLFCHATPRSDEEIVTVRAPADRVRPMLAGVRQRVVVCGHTHLPMDRTVDGVRPVNAGIVGMPYGRPGAYWLWLGPDVCPARTDYDLARAAARVGQTAYPRAAEFASRQVLDPAGEEEGLALLEPAHRGT